MYILDLDDIKFIKECPDCGERSLKIQGKSDYIQKYQYPIGEVTWRKNLLDLRYLLQCVKCKIYFSSIIIKEDTLKLLYTSSDSDNVKKIQLENKLRLLENKIYPHIKTDTKKPKILDIGCYDGNFLEKLPNRFIKYGLEPLSEIAKLAKQKGINVINSKLLEIDVQKYSNYFDIVILLDTIEHLTNFEEHLNIVYTILKPGGKIILETGNIDSTMAKITKNAWYYTNYLEHQLFVSPNLVSSKMHQIGFKTLQNFKTYHKIPSRSMFVFFQYFYMIFFLLVTGFGKVSSLWKKYCRLFNINGTPPIVNTADHFIYIGTKLENKST